MSRLLSFVDRFESHVCRILLASFVTLLFVQILSRQLFGTSITWIEELSVILFVWFAYFGASYAARITAHNRIGFHLSLLPRRTARRIEALGDAFWVGFNLVFIWYAWKLLDPPDEFFAMRVFNYSIIYLMALFAFLLVDHWLPLLLPA